MAKPRSLHALPELALDVARRLGGVARIISTAAYEGAAAVAWEGSHLLLIRDHGWTLTFSLPHGRSWPMQTTEEWEAAEPAIRDAARACERIVTLSDVLLALAPSFPHLAPTFPGTPVPREAWMRSPTQSIGLFQEDRGVRIVVWIENDAVERTVEDRTDLTKVEGLASWLRPGLEKQMAARAAAEAEATRRSALPVPDFDAVLALLHAGHRVSTGGGRWYEIYFVEGGRIRREVFDEGLTDVGDATEAELRKAIGAHPDAFRAALLRR